MLLQSMFGATPLERMAKIAADGASLSGENWERAFERTRKWLRKASMGHPLKASTQDAIFLDAKRAAPEMLQKADLPGQSERLHTIFETVAGPLTALVVCVSPEIPTPEYRRILEFSAAVDRLGVEFSKLSSKTILQAPVVAS